MLPPATTIFTTDTTILTLWTTKTVRMCQKRCLNTCQCLCLSLSLVVVTVVVFVVDIDNNAQVKVLIIMFECPKCIEMDPEKSIVTTYVNCKKGNYPVTADHHVKLCWMIFMMTLASATVLKINIHAKMILKYYLWLTKTSFRKKKMAIKSHQYWIEKPDTYHVMNTHKHTINLAHIFNWHLQSCGAWKNYNVWRSIFSPLCQSFCLIFSKI